VRASQSEAAAGGCESEDCEMNKNNSIGYLISLTLAVILTFLGYRDPAFTFIAASIVIVALSDKN
jgi:hypothetical protein